MTALLQVEISDVTGRVILQQVIPVSQGAGKLSTQLDNGVYIVKVTGGSETGKLQKIIIQK